LTSAVLLPVVLLATGCASAEPQPTDAPTGEAWQSDWVAAEPTDVAPLRGTSVASGSTQHPSLAAKIDNHTAARPQLALERADIVFEQLVEGGITRYVGIWQSDIPELLGPLRSIRPMDADIISPLGGIVAYSGGQEQFVDMMQSTSVVNAVFDTDDTGLFYRDDDRDSPHDVVVTAQELVGRNPELGPPTQQFGYAAAGAGSSAAVDGAPVAVVNTRFSDARWPGWSWDAGAAAYLRSQEGAPDLDGNGSQLRATNVVVLRVGIDWTFGEVPRTILIGGGEAWVSSEGKSLHAAWSKESRDATIRLVDDNGVAVRLAPGNTWIELVPVEDGSVELLP
jgi:hypothetical protein